MLPRHAAEAEAYFFVVVVFQIVDKSLHLSAPLETQVGDSMAEGHFAGKQIANRILLQIVEPRTRQAAQALEADVFFATLERRVADEA